VLSFGLLETAVECLIEVRKVLAKQSLIEFENTWAKQTAGCSNLDNDNIAAENSELYLVLRSGRGLGLFDLHSLDIILYGFAELTLP